MSKYDKDNLDYFQQFHPECLLAENSPYVHAYDDEEFFRFKLLGLVRESFQHCTRTGLERYKEIRFSFSSRALRELFTEMKKSYSDVFFTVQNHEQPGMPIVEIPANKFEDDVHNSCILGVGARGYIGRPGNYI